MQPASFNQDHLWGNKNKEWESQKFSFKRQIVYDLSFMWKLRKTKLIGMESRLVVAETRGDGDQKVQTSVIK